MVNFPLDAVRDARLAVHLMHGFPSQLKQVLHSTLTSLPTCSASNSETSANTSCCPFFATVSRTASIVTTSFLVDLLVLLGNLSELVFETDDLLSYIRFLFLHQSAQGSRQSQIHLSFLPSS